MTATVSARLLRGAVVPVLLALLAGAGCAADRPEHGMGLAGYDADADAGDLGRALERYERLPAPTPGVVKVLSGEASMVAARGTAPLSDGVEVRRAVADDDAALDRLCAGDVDVVEVRRQVDDADEAACAEAGLGLVQLELATTADVLAVTAASALAPACVPDAAVDAAASDPATLATWTQPVATTGAALSLAGPAQGTVADRVAWLAGPRSEAVQATLLPRREEQSAALAAGLSAAVRDAQDALAAFRRARAAGAGPAAATARAEFARLRAAREQARRDYDGAMAVVQTAERARQAQDARSGRMAVLPWGGYVGQGDRLEPLAVSAGPDGACVVPDPGTIADATYPLTRPVLLTVTTRSWERPEVTAYLKDVLAAVPDLAAAAAVVPAEPELVAEQLERVRTGTSSAVVPTPPALPPPAP